MNEYDVQILEPGFFGAALGVTASGDVALVRGNDSVAQRAMLAVATSPGELLHRPDFGAGAERYLGQPVPVAAAALSAAWRATILADDRVLSATVSAKPLPLAESGFVLTAIAETRSNERVTFSYEV